MNECYLFVLICLCVAAFDDANTVYNSRIDGLLLPNDNLLILI
jgi:hypothetical protein